MSSNDRASSADYDYSIGDLSNFPNEVDSASELFTAINDGMTLLSAPMSFESSVVPVKDASSFPSSGLLSIDREVIYYGERTDGSFLRLRRGFSGVRSPHDNGSLVKAAVCADHHNALRDALWNIQNYIGLSTDEAGSSSLYGRLKGLEERFLPLRAVFQAVKRKGQSGELFTFKDLSRGNPVSRTWDFGDGTSSTEQQPTHRYEGSEGQTFDVSLTVIDATGRVSTVRKTEYITIGASGNFVYVPQRIYYLSDEGASVSLYDQSPGLVVQRRWSFGDGTTYITDDPTDYSVTHTFDSPGFYDITLAIQTITGKRPLQSSPIRVEIRES